MRAFQHVLILGCGHMGGALVRRWGEVAQRWGEDTSSSNNFPLPRLFSVVDRSPNIAIGQEPLLAPRFTAYQSLKAFEEKRANLSPQNPIKVSAETSSETSSVTPSETSLPAVDALLLAVRPQQILPALASCEKMLSPHTTVLSLAAGLPIENLRAALGTRCSLFRVMPSIPVAIGEGILLISAEEEQKNAAAEQAVRSLFAPMGVSIVCSEDLLEKGTGLWGSAPGYLFHMMDAFEQAACALGYDTEQARSLAFQTFKGIGMFGDKERAERNPSPQDLVQSIALKGGTTEAGLTVLADQKKGLVALMKQTSKKAYSRTQEMAQEITQEITQK